MKIAVAAMGNTVSGHFGHCENFNIYDAEDGKITAEEVRATVRASCRTSWPTAASR